MHVNWSLARAHKVGGFLLGQALQRRIDRWLGRRPREELLVEHVRQTTPRGDAAAVIAAMDAFARERRWLMNVGPVKGRVLQSAIEDSGARRVLEIGAYCGYSALLIGSGVAARDGHVISIERSRRYSNVAREIIAHAGFADRIQLRTGTLTSEIGSLSGPFDLVFLDHWKDEYLVDLRRLESAGLLRSGTVVVADNIDFFTVRDYLDYVRGSGRYRSRFVTASVEYHESIPDGVEVSTYLGDSPPGR